MFDLSPILAFAATNSELKRRLRNNDYGTVEDHLDKLSRYKLYMPEVLPQEQQVHMGLLMAQLIDAQNNPTRISQIKQLVNEKWLMQLPMMSNKYVPKANTHTTGTILNIVVGCSRDPYFKGDLVDNPRCAGMFRQDVIERIHHHTMPIYMDKNGNIKVFFEGKTDICNIFMEDASLEIPQKSLEYLYVQKGIRKAIVSKTGSRGFEKVEVFELASRIHTETSHVWIFIAIVAVVMVIGIIIYATYASHAVKRQGGSIEGEPEGTHRNQLNAIGQGHYDEAL